MSPELHELKMLSEFQVDEDELSGAAKASSCNQRPNVWYVIAVKFQYLQEHLYSVNSMAITTFILSFLFVTSF